MQIPPKTNARVKIISDRFANIAISGIKHIMPVKDKIQNPIKSKRFIDLLLINTAVVAPPIILATRVNTLNKKSETKTAMMMRTGSTSMTWNTKITPECIFLCRIYQALQDIK